MAGIFIITSGLIAKKANVDYTGFKKDYADGKTMVDQCELYSCNLLKGCAVSNYDVSQFDENTKNPCPGDCEFQSVRNYLGVL